MLSAEQVLHFETFGFLLLRQAFSPLETGEISREFDEVLADDRSHQEFNGAKRQSIVGFIERRPGLTRLVETDLIFEAMEQLLGHGFVWVGSDGHLYIGDTAWHPDSPAKDYRRIKVAIYLDPVQKDTGCLRVIPGSHRSPQHEDQSALIAMKDPAARPFAVAASEIPCFPLESKPGDVVMFDQNTWHASFGGKTGRRMLALNFAAPPVLPEHEASLRKMYNANLEFTRTDQITQTGRVYEEAFLHSDSPRIRSMTGKLVEYGFK
jgi:ectoine hydroxylase-related dioxygenase (phytanoyl-CoA dioxygenase family)